MRPGTLRRPLLSTLLLVGFACSSAGPATTSGSGGILGSDPSTSAFAGLIPTALTQSIMSGGGIGIADQLARAIDPAIGTPSTTKGTS